MAKMTIIAIVQTIFEKKRQNQLYEHQFVRVQEKGTTNIFDVQFYNSKIDLITNLGLKEGDEVTIEANVNGKYWEKEDKSGVFIKVNGQQISKGCS